MATGIAELAARTDQISAEGRAQEADLALRHEAVAQIHLTLNPQPLGVERRAVRIAELAARAVQVAADGRANEAHLTVSDEAIAQEDVPCHLDAVGADPAGVGAGQVKRTKTCTG